MSQVKLYQLRVNPSKFIYDSMNNIIYAGIEPNTLTVVKGYREKYPNYNLFPKGVYFKMDELNKIKTSKTIRIKNTIKHDIQNTNLTNEEIKDLIKVLVDKFKT